MIGRCTLAFKTGPLAGRTFSLGPGDCVFVGSGPECGIRIVDDPTVSVQHACIYYDDLAGKVRLKDMGSEHGTARNGKKLTTSTVIKAGDRITVGQLSTFHSSWWNALQSSRMTRMSRLIARKIDRSEDGGATKSRKLIIVASALVVLLVCGVAVWKTPIGYDESGGKSFAAKVARKVGKTIGKTAGRLKASSVPADRRFIWDEIVSISRRFGDIPPSAMDPGFVKEVEKNIRDYTYRSRHERLLERKNKYWSMITRTLREKNLPPEIGYVVWVESQFEPTAVSPVGAAGLWQLMPETGREYGLTVDEGNDERFDPYKSTVAASTYISDLLRMFKSKRYLLALASYNTGQYRVLRSQLSSTVSGAGQADFWQIRTLLPQETNLYVPRIMAAMIIGRNTKRWSAPEPDVAH